MTEITIQTLQKQLFEIEQRFEPLRKLKLQRTSAWIETEETAKVIRKQLWDMTGDAYGKKKQPRQPRPDDEILNARYDSPDEVPQDVLSWISKNSFLTTSDANDAVRWSRIINTQRDERYPSGDLTLYRAVENGNDIVDEIRPGDWVSTSLKYAQDHLKKSLNGKGSILTIETDGRDVLVSPTGNYDEAIFAPFELSGPVLKEFKSDQKLNCDINRSDF